MNRKARASCVKRGEAANVTKDIGLLQDENDRLKALVAVKDSRCESLATEINTLKSIIGEIDFQNLKHAQGRRMINDKTGRIVFREGDIVRLSWHDSWVDGHLTAYDLEHMEDPAPLIAIGVVVKTSSLFVTLAHQISEAHGDGIYITAIPLATIDKCHVLGQIDPDYWREYP